MSSWPLIKALIRPTPPIKRSFPFQCGLSLLTSFAILKQLRNQHINDLLGLPPPSFVSTLGSNVKSMKFEFGEHHWRYLPLKFVPKRTSPHTCHIQNLWCLYCPRDSPLQHVGTINSTRFSARSQDMQVKPRIVARRHSTDGIAARTPSSNKCILSTTHHSDQALTKPSAGWHPITTHIMPAKRHTSTISQPPRYIGCSYNQNTDRYAHSVTLSSRCSWCNRSDGL